MSPNTNTSSSGINLIPLLPSYPPPPPPLPQQQKVPSRTSNSPSSFPAAATAASATGGHRQSPPLSSSLSSSSPSSSFILWNQALFLITGLVSTMGAQCLNYWHAADSRSLLTVLCTYIGMMLVIALPRDTKKHSDISIHNHTTTSATIPHLSTSISSSSITSSSSAASHHPLLNKKDSSPALVSGDSGSISTPTSCAKNVDFEMDIRGDSDDAYSDGEDSSGGSLLLGGGSGGGRIRRKKHGKTINGDNTFLNSHNNQNSISFNDNSRKASSSSLHPSAADGKSLYHEDVDHKGVAIVALLDVVGQAILTVGLFFIGSGLYQVIYSSVIVFASIYNRIFLRRTMSQWQWMAVITITFGLSLNAFARDSVSSSSPPHRRLMIRGDPLFSTSSASSFSSSQTTSNTQSNTNANNSGMTEEEHARRIAAGFVLTLLGTAIYSSVYTLNDYLLTAPNAKKTSPRAQCFWVGAYCAIVCVGLMLFISIPALASMPLSDPAVAGMYCVLVLSSLGHNIAYFELVNSTGAVATGVLQALRAVLVFILSHVAWCESDAAQCFDARKGLVTVIVIVGVLWFAFAKSMSSSSGGGSVASASSSSSSSSSSPPLFVIDGWRWYRWMRSLFPKSTDETPVTSCLSSLFGGVGGSSSAASRNRNQYREVNNHPFDD